MKKVSQTFGRKQARPKSKIDNPAQKRTDTTAQQPPERAAALTGSRSKILPQDLGSGGLWFAIRQAFSKRKFG